jgi:hypothetical protein
LKLEAKHFEAFEKIKITLLTAPLFCHLIDERATKYMFVDTCTTVSTQEAKYVERWPNTTSAWAGWS